MQTLDEISKRNEITISAVPGIKSVKQTDCGSAVGKPRVYQPMAQEGFLRTVRSQYK
jgi:hypothetical protein